MANRKVPLMSGEIYHLYNRGVDKRIVFTNDSEYPRFLNTVLYYQYPQQLRFSWKELAKSKTGLKNENNAIVKILSFNLMPNHFHLLVRQLTDNGITKFMHNIGTSYTNFFNTKHHRSGSLFQGRFQSVHIKTNEQFLHTMRYIHLNHVVSGLVKKPEDWPWSSHLDYLGLRKPSLLDTQEILSCFSSLTDYKKFIDDQIEYAKELEQIKRDLKDEATS